MMAAETPNEKRARKEKKLDKLSRFGIGMRYENRGPIGKLVDKVTGDDDMYGTSASAGARYAGGKKSDKIWNTEDKTAGEAIEDPRARKAMREAAAEERREARGMKKGGAVKYSKGGVTRADGCAQRGKTKGKMV
jgi:hypothetical protein